MKSVKSNEKKSYLKAFWWLILLLSISGVISDGFLGLNHGFDWSFITQPKFYLKLIFFSVFWLIGFYLLFVKQKYNAEESEGQKIKSEEL